MSVVFIFINCFIQSGATWWQTTNRFPLFKKTHHRLSLAFLLRDFNPNVMKNQLNSPPIPVFCLDWSAHYKLVLYLLWPPYEIGQAIIFLPCGFFLSFFLSIFLLFFSPNLSGRTLDVYHTSTHGVALVRI